MKTMNIKMSINSQLSTTESKKQTKEINRTETEFKKTRRGLGTSRANLNVPTSES